MDDLIAALRVLGRAVLILVFLTLGWFIVGIVAGMLWWWLTW